MRYVAMVMLVVLACFDLSLAHATGINERESLRGIQGMAVVIEKINKDAQADGLSEDSIRTAVELILRSSGIRILTQAELLGRPSSGYLDVQIGMQKESSSSSLYGFHITVAFNQLISLSHRPEHTMYAPTWEAGNVGVIGSAIMSTRISIWVEQKVKEFANDFLAVNPR